MATLYFYAGGSGGSWENTSNWYEDIDHLTNHGAVPTSEDDVILLDSATSGFTTSAYCNTLTTGSYSIDNGSSTIYVTTTASLQWGGTYGGNIQCPDVQFSNGTSHNGSVTGNASFYNSSYMGVGTGGNVSGSASFYNTSYLYDTSGIYTWPTSLTFDDTSHCDDDINPGFSITPPNITFNGSSYVISTVTIAFDVTFNSTSQNLGIITGIATFNVSSQNGDGMVMTTSVGSGSVFNDSSIHRDGATVDGDAFFNGTSYCYGNVDGTATFSKSAAENMLDNEALPGTIGAVIVQGGGGINGSSILGIL
jgi:hypothetical protein